MFNEEGLLGGIQHLNLVDAQFEDSLLTQLPFTVTQLVLTSEPVKDGDLETVRNLTQLTQLIGLTLEGKRTGVEAVEVICKSFPQLTSLELKFDAENGKHVIELIASHLGQLTSLQLIGIESTGMDFTGNEERDYCNDASALASAKQLTQLATLKVINHTISDKGVTAFAQGLLSLTVLDLDGHMKTIHQGVIAVAQNLSHLTELHLYPTQINEKVAEILAANLTNLTVLSLPYGHLASDEHQKGRAAQMIEQGLSRLTYLDLTDVNFN